MLGKRLGGNDYAAGEFYRYHQGKNHAFPTFFN
jgi:hypothetical protein